MIKIVLDAGHGPDTAGKRTPKFENGSFMHEHEFNNAVVQRLKNKLNTVGKYSVTVVSSKTKDIPLSQRVTLERTINSDLFLSVHANALTGVWGSQHGIESYSNIGSTKGAKYCKVIQNGLINSTKLTNRGCKTSSFYVLKNTYGPAVLVECGFMDNKEESKLLMSENYRELIACSLFKSINEIFNINIDEVEGFKIIGEPTTTIKQMKQWATERNANQLFIDTADIFYKVAVKEGCDPTVVYAQSAKETGFFRFGGVIDASYHNTCGLKISNGGGNYDPNAHNKFKDWEEGITAHVHHLLLYAGSDGYPLADTPDPRHFNWIFGKAPVVEMLSGKWAPSPTYGQSIIEHYINGMLDTEVVEMDFEELYYEAMEREEKRKDKLIKLLKKLEEIYS